MSPRPYRLGARQAASEETRARIVSAARDLLMSASSASSFSIDAVARRADVARMTVYYQFGSKAGLLEGLMDDLAARGQMRRLGEVFQEADPVEALARFVAAFGRFWTSGRLVIRRLHAFAMLDPVIEKSVSGRAAWRREGLEVLMERVAAKYGRPPPEEQNDAVDVLQMLTGFESFDALAGRDRSPEDVIPQIARLAISVLGVDPTAPR